MLLAQCWRTAWMTMGILIVTSSTIAGARGTIHDARYPARRMDTSDIDACHQALVDADADANFLIDREEYVTFVTLLGDDDILVNSTMFDQLPGVLRDNFRLVGCLCDTCCLNGSESPQVIDIKALLPEEQETDGTLLSYLNDVCVLAEESLEEYSDSIEDGGGDTNSTQTAQPTAAPNNSSSLFPSQISLNTTTMAPSLMPSSAPSEAPSNSESSLPSAIPTAFESDPPSLHPMALQSAKPTDTPSPPPPPEAAGPTNAPTHQVDLQVQIEYTIQLAENTAPADIQISNLIDAMDDLATDVVNEVVFTRPSESRMRVRNRHLAVLVDLPTELVAADGSPATTIQDASEQVDCPTSASGTTSSTTLQCQNVTALIGLILDDERPQVAKALYESAMNAAMANGRFQEVLEEVNATIPVLVVTAVPSSAPQTDSADEPSSDSSDGISFGVIIGIIAGVLIIILAILAIFKLKPKQTDEGYNDLEVAQPQEDNFFSLQDGLEFQRKDDDDVAKMAVTPVKSPTTSFRSHQSRSDDPRLTRVSDTGSIYSDMHPASTDSIEVTGMDATDGVIVGMNRTSLYASGRSPDNQQIEIQNMVELETALADGDWGAVGHSAQYLATQEHIMDSDSSYSSYSQVSSLRGGSWRKQLDFDKVDELDRLIEDGNWEGIVAAAARFDDQSIRSIRTGMDTADGLSVDSRLSYADSRMSQTDSNVEPAASIDNESGRTTPSTLFSDSAANTGDTSVTASTTPTVKRSREEIRKEVVDLVTKVVPDEASHIDEMMLEFKGKEEQLVEALRGMQERQLTRKAQDTTNQIAKMEARNQSTLARAQREKESSTILPTQQQQQQTLSSRDSALSPPHVGGAQQTQLRGDALLGPDAANQSMESDDVLDTSNTASTDIGGQPDEGGQDVGFAEVAAEWAIQQSLSQLSKDDADQ